jgi:hypothetical protein
MCAMNGLRPGSYCRLVADFSRITCDLEEHLLALISGHTQEWDKDYQQNQSFAGVNEWRLDLEKRKNP